MSGRILNGSLRENCPSTRFLLVLIFPLFGQNTRKYAPEEAPYLDTFHAVDDPGQYVEKPSISKCILLQKQPF